MRDIRVDYQISDIPKKKAKIEHLNYGKICAGKLTFSCNHHQDIP